MMVLHVAGPPGAHIEPEVQAWPFRHSAQKCFWLIDTRASHHPGSGSSDTLRAAVFLADDVHKNAMYVPVTKNKDDYPLI